MKIYIDIVLIINYVYDFMILTSVSILLKKNIKVNRIFLGSLIGELSLITLFISIGGIYLLLFKIIQGLLMIIVTFGKKNIINNLFYFFVITIILGGSGYLLENRIIPLFLSPFILYLYIKENKKYKISITKYYKVVLVDKKDTYLLNGYMDTGNNLIDPITRLPVIMISNKYKFKSKKFYFVPYKVLNGKGIIKCIKLDKVIIDGKIINCLVGLVDNDILKNKDVILNENIREMIMC